MAKNITAKVLKEFSFKGEVYGVDDEITMAVGQARPYINLGWIKLTKDEAEKVEVFNEKKEKAEGSPVTAKNAKAGPK